MDYDSISKKTLSDERRVNAGNKNTLSIHHPRRRNVTTSMIGIKTVTYAKISPKMVNPRDIAGARRRRRLQCQQWKQNCFGFSKQQQWRGEQTANHRDL